MPGARPLRRRVLFVRCAHSMLQVGLTLVEDGQGNDVVGGGQHVVGGELVLDGQLSAGGDGLEVSLRVRRKGQGQVQGVRRLR